MEYQIKRVTNRELLDIHQKGYSGRYVTSRPKSSDYILEVFEIDQPPTIYINNNHSKAEYHYIMAHCQGHLEFMNANGLLEGLRKPRLREDVIDTVPYEKLDLFLDTMRTLALTSCDLDSRFIAPIQYFLSKPNWFQTWQYWLLKLVDEEALYFNAIKRTKLMNEGYATWRQDKTLKALNLSPSEKMELTYLEAKLHAKPDEGLNYYSLGKALWQEVSNENLLNVIRLLEDHQFIKRYYTKVVHEKENISVVLNEEILNDYQSVKEYLIQFFKYRGPILYVDQVVTEETGYLTLRYHQLPHSRQLQFNQLKRSLQEVLNQTVYFKPMSSNIKNFRKLD